ncbi:MAG: hypothetical protein GF419_04655 [Ignavibacteriales bacterium]|nr:hypothetical protein [Ignavibacteriales bacterium]
MDDREFAEEARRLLERAIANRLQEERKIVLSLSGGVDSTTVGAMTARALGANETLKCVSSVLPPNAPASATDEREYIQALLAAESNIRTDYRYPLERTPLERIDERVRELGQPTYFFSFLEDELFSSAARQGGRAFWSGFGGDSFLSFSGTYAAARLLLDGAWGTLRRRFAEAKRAGANLSFRRVLAQAIYSRSASLRRWRGVELLPRDIVDDAPVRADERETLWEKLQTAAPTPLRTDYFQEMLIDEFSSGRAAAKMARVQERMGLFGLSFTAPTLDDMVVEFVLALPPDQFIAQGARRSLLRRATKGVLPERIRLRADKTPYLPDVAARKQETGAAARDYFLATEADDETWKLVDRRRALEAAEIAAGAPGADFGERMRRAEYAFNAANILALSKYARESSKLNQSIIDSRM